MGPERGKSNRCIHFFEKDERETRRQQQQREEHDLAAAAWPAAVAASVCSSSSSSLLLATTSNGFVLHIHDIHSTRRALRPPMYAFLKPTQNSWPRRMGLYMSVLFIILFRRSVTA